MLIGINLYMMVTLLQMMENVSPASFAATIPSFDLSKSEAIEFEMTEKISMGDGSQSNNPWLQELPDPLSRACWDNYLAMSASTAGDLGITNWNVSNGALKWQYG